MPEERSAANPSATDAAVDRWDRETDRRTLDRFIDPAPHTMRAVSIKRRRSYITLMWLMKAEESTDRQTDQYTGGQFPLNFTLHCLKCNKNPTHN